MPARSRRRPESPTPGMVFAVPRAVGGFYLLVHLASNQFGDAFGRTVGWTPEPTIPPDTQPHPGGDFFYTGTHFIVNRRWRLVGHRPDWLAVFPAEPEIYHHKGHHRDNPKVGLYGAAETAAGRLRDLSAEEYATSPLADPEYRQVRLEEEAEEHLQRREGQ